MTLGNAAAAHVRLIVWCRERSRQVEPDPAELAGRYGAETAVLEWKRSARLFRVWQPQSRHGGQRNRAEITERSIPTNPLRHVKETGNLVINHYEVSPEAVDNPVENVDNQRLSVP